VASLLLTGELDGIAPALVRAWRYRHPHAKFYSWCAGPLSDVACTPLDIATDDGRGLTTALQQLHIRAIVHAPSWMIGDERAQLSASHVLVGAAASAARDRPTAQRLSLVQLAGPDLWLRAEAPIVDHHPLAAETSAAAVAGATDLLLQAAAARGQLLAATLVAADPVGPRLAADRMLMPVLTAVLDGRRVPLHGQGDERLFPTGADDIGRCLGALLAAPDLHGRYGLSGPTVITRHALLAAICQETDQSFAASAALRAAFPRCPAAQARPCSSLITVVQDRRRASRPRTLALSRLADELQFSARDGLNALIKQAMHAATSAPPSTHAAA
jgi:hypothetical protein